MDAHTYRVGARASMTAGLLFAIPAIVFAAPATFAQLVNLLVQILNLLVGLLSAVAVAIFFWGIIKYLFSVGGGEGVEEGKQLMVWGIIALFVLFCVFGITQVFVRLLTG